MSTSYSPHYENAHFLRGLAEKLPQLLPQEEAPPAQIALLHQLADEEIEQAEHDEWIREKVARARAETEPGWTTDEVKAQLRAYAERRQSAQRPSLRQQGNRVAC